MQGPWNLEFPAAPEGSDLWTNPAVVSGGLGIATVYLTDNGLITGKALYKSIKFVHANFVSNDPNLGRSLSLSGDLKTLTITAVKQTFTGIVILTSINVLGSVTLGPAPDGTTLNVLVQGTNA